MRVAKITEKQKAAALPTMAKLSKEIRQKRRSKELSEQALADKVNCSRSTISSIENGEYNTNFILLIDICRELSIRTIKIED
jgi:DNA-binding XRE family transcriptional regulator